MNIGIDARYVYDHFPGIGRYLANLIFALGEIHHKHTLVLIYNPDLPNTRYDWQTLRHATNIKLVSTRVRPFTLSEQVQIPRLARTLELDLLHSPYYIKPYVGMPCPSLVSIYDLIGQRFPATLAWRTRQIQHIAMRLAVRSATRIITLSQSARADIIAFYQVPPERIAVTPAAADPRFSPQPAEVIAAVQTKHHLPARYLLYIGANKPHKNLECLICAWAHLVREDQPTTGTSLAGEIVLVIAGQYDPRYPAAQHLVAELGVESTVRFIQNVAEGDLPALYSGAELFVFPSYYEGFGLPPLEAMACGTPVICTNASSLPEVVGDAAIMVTPHDSSELAAAIRRLLADPALRATQRERGLRRTKEFSWHRTAEQTLQIYEKDGGRRTKDGGQRT